MYFSRELSPVLQLRRSHVRSIITCCREVLGAACERRGVDLTRVEVLDSSSTLLPLLTTETCSLGGRHLRVTSEYALFMLFPCP